MRLPITSATASTPGTTIRLPAARRPSTTCTSALTAPARYLISPEPESAASFLARLEKALAAE